jgi:hypothetical protein
MDKSRPLATEAIPKESRVSRRERILLDNRNITDISTSRLQMPALRFA